MPRSLPGMNIASAASNVVERPRAAVSGLSGLSGVLECAGGGTSGLSKRDPKRSVEGRDLLAWKELSEVTGSLPGIADVMSSGLSGSVERPGSVSGLPPISGLSEVVKCLVGGSDGLSNASKVPRSLPGTETPSRSTGLSNEVVKCLSGLLGLSKCPCTASDEMSSKIPSSPALLQ